MPRERVTMRKIREILRLVWSCNQSRRDTSRTCGVGKSTVDDTINRAVAAGFSWPLPADLDDEALELRLYPPVVNPASRKLPQPDWRALHDELVKHKKLTLMLLWQEYKEGEPSGYQYSQFCELYRQWRKKLDRSMRQEHRAGEKFFVDYSGQTVPVVDATTGEVRDAQMFVGVMGGSNQTYADATWTQSLADWTGSHVRAFGFMDAVPHCIVPDNLLSAVTKTCRYEPDINPTYAALADHYGTAIVPARVRHPKDKAKVEGGVLIAQRFILAGLRNRTFFSLAEANAAIRERLLLLNNRPFRKLPGCRQSRFEEIDLPAMLPLPETPYEYAQWKKARVHIDYHVELEGHFYSVPHRLVKEQVDVRYTETIVECFYKGNRVASHPKSSVQGKHTTTPEHMPKAHREFAEWTPERIISWAAQTGTATAQVVETILSRKAYPEHGFRSCMGIISLAKRYTKERLEAACERAVTIKGVTYRSIKSILENNLDQKALPKQMELLPVAHENIRGTDYYNDERKLYADTTDHREAELDETDSHG
ncbi:IS21 family transposase [Geobacter benzoatilyticus]|uniref:IS21 family transposase n=2 Tax=Geobacter benzoatilyticus TaxID=2815309 RepID=A0ABX7Q0N4_9BACT|nr:IS21 family transposase [Geobacter benzoatilyticus]QSV44954.1 IS21 family transposase [Geobacter benzoatilyticus]QSV44973.1 IS21 family transposase [Geobacter benzoatilyticus]QSV45405.1 IS21 family transposase [Geobacter benzoatilyticus]QSV45472.1 IS21 family transposase [Geobacter benzoatilyticus]